MTVNYEIFQESFKANPTYSTVETRRIMMKWLNETEHKIISICEKDNSIVVYFK